MNKIFLLCNAHIDPVWQWDVPEGMGAALSTFRCAADFCEEYDSFVFNHNEALLYRFIEQTEPELFAHIQQLVKAGKWNIMGGFELQPDCVMPLGETYIRQILRGHKYFWEKFGVRPTIAVNVDSFGHSKGLVQILKKCGYTAYIFMRPEAYKTELPVNFKWRGLDGSKIIAHRFTAGYNSLLGENKKELFEWVSRTSPQDTSLYPWGVGNHGGGPSRQDLDDIADMMKNGEPQGYELVHATPEQFIQTLYPDSLPVVDRSLYSSMVGCYTSMLRIKQQHKRLENTLLSAEKMASAALLCEGLSYPVHELDEAFESLSLLQFHDSLPGTITESVMNSMLVKAAYGLELAERVRSRAFFTMARRQPAAPAGYMPVLVYNPHPYPITHTVVCEYVLQNQNWDEGTMTSATVFHDGQVIPSQIENEESCIPLDWRKRIVFHADLAPLSMNRFDCRLEVVQKPDRHLENTDALHFSNPDISVTINGQTGWIQEWIVLEQSVARDEFGKITVFEDDLDPWHMRGDFINTIKGEFTLLTGEALSNFLGVQNQLPAIRIIEDGDVRRVVEAAFTYGQSYAVVRYRLPKQGHEIEMSIDLICNEKDTMIKMAFPTPLESPEWLAETMFGVESAFMDGREVVSHRFDMLKDTDGRSLSVLNDCVYGGGFHNGTLYKNLLRTPAFCAHPVEDRAIVPQDRFVPRMECGKSNFTFRLIPGDETVTVYDIAKGAQVMNEPPMCVSYFPSGYHSENRQNPPAVTVDGKVIVSALGQFGNSDPDEGLSLRLYEPAGETVRFSIQCPAFEIEYDGNINPFEIRTFYIQNKKIRETAISDPYFDPR